MRPARRPHVRRACPAATGRLVGGAIAIALTIAAALGACTAAGPEYHLPPSAAARRPAAAAPFQSASDPAYSPADLPDHWWALYRDADLDAHVAEALAANADLRAADANLRRAAAVVREVAGNRSVATTLSGGVALARPYGTVGGYAGSLGYDAGASLAYPLDLAGAIRRAVEAAQGDAAAVAAARDDVRVTVAAETTRSQADACSANATLAATRRVVATQQRTLDLTRELVRGGRGTAFDVTRAQAAVEQSAAQIPSIVASRSAALYRLASLMGRTAAAYPAEVEACPSPPTLQRPLPVGDGAALLRRRPDLRSAERTLAAATARIGVATAALYPQVTLGATVGATGPTPGLPLRDALRFSLGPLVSWTFPNRRVVRAQIEEAGADADAALARFDAAVLEALRQTETALAAYARELDRHDDLTRARDTAATAADQADRLYRNGRSDVLSLLTAQASLATAEVTLASSSAQLTDRQIDVFAALGGGWQP